VPPPAASPRSLARVLSIAAPSPSRVASILPIRRVVAAADVIVIPPTCISDPPVCRMARCSPAEIDY
jgi:hypothetical protein